MLVALLSTHSYHNHPPCRILNKPLPLPVPQFPLLYKQDNLAFLIHFFKEWPASLSTQYRASMLSQS